MSHRKVAPNPNQTCITSANLKVKFRIWRRWHLRLSVHGILQARILEWAAIPFSRGSSWPRDQTRVSCTAGRFFTIWATREAPKKTQSIQNHKDSLVHLICNFTEFHRGSICCCQFRLFHEPILESRVPGLPKLIPCFNLTQPWEGKTRYFEYLQERFCGVANPSPVIYKLINVSMYPGNLS